MVEPALTVAEVAELLRVDPRTVYDIIGTGRLKVIDIGTGKRPNLRVTPTEYERYLKSCEVKDGRAAA